MAASGPSATFRDVRFCTAVGDKRTSTAPNPGFLIYGYTTCFGELIARTRLINIGRVVSQRTNTNEPGQANESRRVRCGNGESCVWLASSGSCHQQRGFFNFQDDRGLVRKG